MQLMQDVAVGVSEGIAMNYLTKQPTNQFKLATSTADDAGKAAAKGAKGAQGTIARLGGRIVSSKAAKTVGKTAIAQATKKAMKLFISKLISAGIAIKQGVIVAIKSIGKIIVKGLAVMGVTMSSKLMARLGTIGAGQILAKSVVAVAGALSIVDGAAIVLGLWDPGGWEMTINKDMIKSTRDSYYRSYLKYYDNKALFSESQVIIKKEKEKIYNKFFKEYDKNKTPENKAKMEVAQKEYNDAVDLMYKLQWKGSERPKEHGGPLIYPALAYPDFPYNEDGEWLDPKLEEEYYYQIDQYMKKNNLVWTEEELKQEEYKAEVVYQLDQILLDFSLF